MKSDPRLKRMEVERVAWTPEKWSEHAYAVGQLIDGNAPVEATLTSSPVETAERELAGKGGGGQ